MSAPYVSPVRLASEMAEWKTAPGLPFEWGADPDLWLYRGRTLAILYRYLRLSCESGRVPSILGQELARHQVSSYTLSSFEDVVIFVHDVERSILRLGRLSQELIARIALQGFTHEEASRLTGVSRRSIRRRYAEALDELTEMLLKVGIILRFPETEPDSPEACQEAETGISSLTM